ncbi:MAG: TonB-dependent receptor [Steroidobacteraceae bacterium]
MTVSHTVRDSVRRALATSALALLGAGGTAAYAQQATTAQPNGPQVSAAKASTAKTTTAKTIATKTPIVLAQASTVPQATSSSSAAPIQLETVVVTGTLISRPAAETAEAITILKADTIKDQGVENVEQALDMLTSNVPAINMASAVGSFSGGGTYASLRDLGTARTLVLLDGQRLAPNAFSGNAVDLSGIPFSAIDSVQVLREGASSLYGSDAIAGVINFITKKNYQGAEVQANFDHPQEAGGGSGEADFTLGHGDLASDGYNFMITASYSKQQELLATQRAFSAAGFDPAGGIVATNYPGSWPGLVQDSNGNRWQSGYPACAGNPQLTEYFGDCSYRYSAATDLLPESHEMSGMASFTKSLPANNQVQLQYFYTQSELTGYAGPMFYNFALDPSSPYFPTASQLICGRGPQNCTTTTPNLTGISTTGVATPVTAYWTDPNNYRYTGNMNVEQRVLLTFSGSNAGWNYSTDINYSKNSNDNRNDSGIPDEAMLAPGGVLSDLINPFGPQTAAGQALINSSYIDGVYELGQDTRWSLDGQASHELGDAFNSGTPATVALGFTVNGEHFAVATTPYNNLVAAATGLTASAVEGSRTVQAAFVELDVPIAKSLDLDIADRQDRYSDFGTSNNPKLSVRYQPASFLTFRGTASTGFRAPTLFDLYQSPSLAASSSGTMGQANPFCAPGKYNAEWTETACQSQGIGLYGGNRNLTPETSQNFDLGVIISPIQDLGITLDYYRILVKNTISTVPASAIYSNPTAFSSYIVTNSSGTLTPTISEAANCTPYTAATCGYITETFENTGRITTSGVDLSVQYLEHTPIGIFHEDLEGTAITQYQLQQYTGGPEQNLVGWFNNIPTSGDVLQVAYRWQHNLRVDWTSPGRMWGAGLAERFYSRYVDEYPTGPTNSGPLLNVGSYSLVDGYVSVRPIKNLTVLFGIKNILNRYPPFTDAPQDNFAAGYNALEGDPLLRNFYVNLKYVLF